MKKFVFAAVLSALAVAMTLPAFAEEAKKEAKPAAAAPKAHDYTGTIKMIDAAKATLTVTDKAGADKEFTVSDKAKIATGDKAAATLADLKVGEKIKVTYAEEAGKITVTKIAPAAPAEKKAPKAEKKDK